jgi:hypothetical protein
MIVDENGGAGGSDPPDIIEIEGGGQPSGVKPRLQVDKANPERTVTALRDIFVNAGGLFERGRLVKVIVDPIAGGAVAHVMTPAALIIAAHEISRPWMIKETRHGPQEVDCGLPQAMALMYNDHRDWRLMPLNGVASSPLLSADGGIRIAEGYDEASGLWCENMPADVADMVPLKPTKDDAARSLLLIRETFRTFCFADAAMVNEGCGVRAVDLAQDPGMDESSFLASFLSAPCRPSLWLAPGIAIRAAQISGAGTGKGLLVRCICEAAYGRQPSAVTAGGNREELEKRISTELIEAGPSVFLDNFNNLTLRSAALASALTERPARIRVFGKLVNATLNALAQVFATGNGLMLAEDLARRFILTELDAYMEDPERRSFAVDVLKEVARRRSQFLAAALTIWRYGRLAQLTPGEPLGSYESWCAQVRDPLLALGCRDPVERISDVKKRDPDRQALAALFGLWWTYHRDFVVRAHELNEEVRKQIDPQGRGRQFVAAYLERRVGARFGGYVFTRQTSPGKWSAATYKLIRTGEASDYDDAMNAAGGYRADAASASYAHATGRQRARAVIDGADDDGSNAFD